MRLAASRILFCREKNMEREIWDGFRYGPDAAREQFGFDAAHPVSALDAEVPKLMANAPAIFYALGSNARLDAQVQRLAAVGAGPGARRRHRAEPPPSMCICCWTRCGWSRMPAKSPSCAAPRRSRRPRTSARCAPRGPACMNTRSRPSCCTSSAATAPSSRPIPPSSPPAPMPACCITAPATQCCRTATWC